MTATQAHRRPLRFWGWGYADEQLSQEERELVAGLGSLLGGGSPVAEPTVDEYALPAPRIDVPGKLADIVSVTPYDRLTHAYGKSLADSLRLLLREVPNPPDLVAFPRGEDDIVELMELAATSGAALIPFGGGTSVCGGVEPDVGGDYGATISVDLQYMNKVLEVDRTSRAALIEGGALGPELEAQLKGHDLTLRHFPQSFQFSTLGGWIATRAGGHFASNYTHIDDFVESTRTLTPGGVLESRRLPGSGAGPSPDRMIIGSEGTLGFITQAWMRLQDRPRFRASASISFPSMEQACVAVRAVSQAALFPSNCRLLDPVEAQMNGVGDGASALLVLAFESADHALDAWMTRALELVEDHGGTWDKEAVARSLKGAEAADDGEHRKGAAGAWRNQFLRAPYYRNLATPMGLILDTFETAITWDRFPEFYRQVRERLQAALTEITGQDGILSCRFTHIYPDGPAPYFTFYARGSDSGDLRASLDRWKEIKLAANEAVVSLGGTVTHHHAVGRDHRPRGYDEQAPALFRQAFSAAKSSLDPEGIMNPGALVDIPARGAGQGGIFRAI